MVMSLWPRFLAHTVGRSSPSCWEGPNDFLFSVSSETRKAEVRGSSDSVAVFKLRRHSSSLRLSLSLLTNTLPGPSASEVTTVRRYTNLFIIIITRQKPSLKSMGEAHFRTPPLRNPSTNFDLMLNILLRPPRELMCKIWLESIRPLRICACVKKHGLCGFFY